MASADRVPFGCDGAIVHELPEDEEKRQFVVDAVEPGGLIAVPAEATPSFPGDSIVDQSLILSGMSFSPFAYVPTEKTIVSDLYVFQSNTPPREMPTHDDSLCFNSRQF